MTVGAQIMGRLVQIAPQAGSGRPEGAPGP
jgi:hypothetical protein